MSRCALIGGSGFAKLAGFEVNNEKQIKTPYGQPSAAIVTGRLHGEPVVFLARHGRNHEIPPHRINYRANIWALKQAGSDLLISIAAVGGISAHCVPGKVVVPDQIIDYTWGREQTFYDGIDSPVAHIEFTQPYCEELRNLIIRTCKFIDVRIITSGCYAATQGPRFETSAEVQRLANDGADIVGMTGMPEASLARELGLCYATLALIVNPAAGIGHGVIEQSDISKAFAEATGTIHRILEAVLPEIGDIEYVTPAAVEP